MEEVWNTRYIYEDERSPHLEFTDKRRSAARMFASRGERQGSPFLRETVASLTAERRGRNWPRVGERPQASATFSFLQPSRWPIHFTYRCLSFPLSLSNRPPPPPWSLVSGPRLPSPPLQRPSSRLHAPTPPTASGHRPTVAAFSAVYAAALCAGLCAA